MMLWTTFSILSMKKYFQEQYGLLFSRADGFVIMDSITIKGWVLFPIAFCLCAKFMEKESAQYIIRKKKRSYIWYAESISILFISLYLTIIESVSVLITVFSVCRVNINWDERKSVFWNETGRVLEETVLFSEVAISYFITTTVSFFLLGIFTGVVKRFTDNLLLTYVIVIAAIVLRIEMRDLIPVHGIEYGQWLSVQHAWFYLCVGVTVLLLVVGRWLVERKDLYGK